MPALLCLQPGVCYIWGFVVITSWQCLFRAHTLLSPDALGHTSQCGSVLAGAPSCSRVLASQPVGPSGGWALPI